MKNTREELKESLRVAAQKTDTQIKQLSAEAKDASTDAKAKVQEVIEGLNEEKQSILDYVKEVENASKDQWDHVQEEASTALMSVDARVANRIKDVREHLTQ